MNKFCKPYADTLSALDKIEEILVIKFGGFPYNKEEEEIMLGLSRAYEFVEKRAEADIDPCHICMEKARKDKTPLNCKGCILRDGAEGI